MDLPEARRCGLRHVATRPVGDLDPAAALTAVSLADLQHGATLSADSGRSQACPYAGACGVFVLAAAIVGWNCGNVGPVVGSLQQEFDIGLGEVGLLSGAFFFAGSAVGSLVGAALARKIRVLVGIWACCVLSAVGNLVFAVGDSFGVLAVGPGLRRDCVRPGGRLHPGLRPRGGWGEDGRPVRRRAHAGRRGRAAYWAASSRARTSDWRVAFLITAALAVVALPILPNERVEIPRTASRGRGPCPGGAHEPGLVAGAAARLTTLTIPLVVGAWLVHFLITGYGMSAARRGARLRALRDLGGDAGRRGPDDRLRRQSLAAGHRRALGPRGGRARLARRWGLHRVAAVVALVLIGDRALPALPALLRRGRAGPPGPADRQPRAHAGRDRDLPDPVIPAFGAALASGDADLAFAGLAAFTVLTLVLNARPPVPPREPAPAEVSATSADPG